MKKKRYFTLSFILFLFCMPKTYASCTQEEINEFKKIEDDYKVTYEFNKASKDYTLYLTSTQPDKYYYQIYTEADLECSVVDETTVKCINFAPDIYSIEITGVTDTCNDVLKNITLNLPKYNKYSEDPLCKGIEEFVLCSPTYDKEIDYETFVSRVETYKRTKAKEEEKQQDVEQQDDKISDQIVGYINDNLVSLIIIGVFIILVIITVIVTAKSIRKSRRLE